MKKCGCQYNQHGHIDLIFSLSVRSTTLALGKYGQSWNEVEASVDHGYRWSVSNDELASKNRFYATYPPVPAPDCNTVYNISD